MERLLIAAAVVACLLVALYFLGRSGGDAGDGEEAARTLPTVSTQTQTQARSRTTSTTRTTSETGSRPRRRLARLQIVPTGPVYVCLRRAGGEAVVNGLILQEGSRQPTYRSRRFRLLLGNGEARLRINGRLRQVPPVSNGIGYEITPRRVRTLPPASRPRCSA